MLPSVDTVRQFALGCLPIGIFLLLAGCVQERERPGYIARVGSAELTSEELAAAVDTAAEGRDRAREYVNDWIIRELLYQEAERRGVTNSEEVRRQMDETRRRLAIAALLERELYDQDDSSSVTDDAVRAYLSSAGNEFALREDVILLSYAQFAERDAANAFRSLLLRGISWVDALLQVERDSLYSGHVTRATDRIYATQSTLYPQELWKMAQTLKPNEVSFAIRTPIGHFILQIYSVRKQGEAPELEYIRNEIRARILMERRRTAYEKLVGNLRARYPVDFQLPGLDTQTQN